MTQKEKELLLKDLCARLPYGIKAHTKIGTDIIVAGVIDDTVKDETEDSFDISFITPYLRPMSSMTEEELKEFRACHCVYDLHPSFQPMMCNIANEQNMFDWLLAHHFDVRGLIEKGLALEAPEGMYKTE